MTNPRYIAVKNLLAVTQGKSLDKAFIDNIVGLPDKEIALAKELSFGLCRWYFQLDYLIEKKLTKPFKKKDKDIHCVLMLGAYQLLYTRVAQHAAISTSVELTRDLKKDWASKLVNAVLREIQRDLEKSKINILLNENNDLKLKYSQQEWFIKEVQNSWPSEAGFILEAFQQRAPMTLRLNIKRKELISYMEELKEKGINSKTVENIQSAIILENPIKVNQIPGFSDGLVSIQDAGAQFAAYLLDVKPNQNILDACAAPGGKLGHILEIEKELSIVAMDINFSRLKLIEENLKRLKYECKILKGNANKPPIEWQSGIFDRILLDVPCSASGVIRRHPDIRLIRKFDDIEMLLKRQIEMLDAVWPCLRDGGKLLYCTCSILPQENEEQIKKFLNKNPNANEILLPKKVGIKRAHGRQIIPGRQMMDGFYYALLEKKVV